MITWDVIDTVAADFTGYTYRVRAANAAGQSDPSDPVTVMVELPPEFIAHRTGLNWGVPVYEFDDEGERIDDPTLYVILTNNNFDQGGPVRAYDQETADVSGDDPDLAKFTLKKLPPGLFQGEVRIELSDPASVRVFKDDGTVLFDPRDPYADPDVLWFDLEDPDGKYLAGVMAADMDIWLEGLVVDTNFSFSYVFDGELVGYGYIDGYGYFISHGPQQLSDKVHMLIAEWAFVGIDGTEIFAPVPLRVDALLAAAEDGPWLETVDAGGGSSSSFFKSRIKGLPFSLSHEIVVVSDAYPSDLFDDELEEAADGSVISKHFTVLYNSDMYLADDHGPLSSNERDLILNNLMLNAVHNTAATATAKTDQDEHQRSTETYRPVIISGLTTDIVGTNSIISGLAKVDAPNWEEYKVWAQLFRGGQLVDQTDFFNRQAEQDFEFTLVEPGWYILEVNGFGGEEPWGFGEFSILVDDEIAQSTHKKAAWEALRIDEQVGSVSLDTVIRNRRITELYVEMYNEHPDLKYYGFAAPASRIVGDAMASASLGALTAMFANLIGIKRLPILGETASAREDIHEAGVRLGRGNWAIYMDIYPTALAYTSDGGNNIQAVRAMIPDQQNPLRRAWEEIHAGRTADPKDVDKIWEGAKMVVDYEQRHVLQPVLGDLQFWTDFTQTYGARIRAPYPGAQWFLQFNPNGNYGNADHRMDWFNNHLFQKGKDWLESLTEAMDEAKLLRGGYGI